MNSKELVKAGHQFAAAMSTDTPIIEIAKLVTQLASALDEQSGELTAALNSYENAMSALREQNQHSDRPAVWVRMGDDNHAPDCTLDNDEAREWNSLGLEVVRMVRPAPVAVPDDVIREEIYGLANHIAGAKSGMPDEWQDWADDIEGSLRKLLRLNSGSNSDD